MSSNTIPPSAEVLIVPPADDPAGLATRFVKQCVNAGVDFHFEPGDRLPRDVPQRIRGVKAVIIDGSALEKNQAALAWYREHGAAVYTLHLDQDANIPNSVGSWASPRVLHAVSLDAGLTAPSPSMRQRMAERDVDEVVRRLADRLLQWDAKLWYDATCYNWEAMLNLSEVTADPRFADRALDQMRRMMRDVENRLDNCDCVAPFRPMLRIAERRGLDDITAFVRQHIDRYTADTPRCRGCFVNFASYARSVRAEVLFQVLPSMMLLGRVTGDESYREAAWDQLAALERCLFDEARGMWQHGAGPAGFTNVFWARHVGFTLLAQVMLLEFSEEGDTRREALLEKLRRGCANLHHWQNPAGFFYCVVDNPRSQEESSGTAWIAGALFHAVRQDWLDASYEEVAERAWCAALSRVWDGDFPGHMVATTVSHVPGYYDKLPLAEQGWPHFALLAWHQRALTRRAEVTRDA